MWRRKVFIRNFLIVCSTVISPTAHHPLDWSNSEIGLFLGLLSLVTLTITLILYFSLVNQTDYQLIASVIININDTLINAMMIMAIIIGFVQVQNLKFVKTENEHDSLLLIGASGAGQLRFIVQFYICFIPGLFLYAIFTVTAGCLGENAVEPPTLVITNGIFEIVQGEET